jgi:hypothetical protein
VMRSGTTQTSRCAECGYVSKLAREYHPYAFCVLVKAGMDPWVVVREGARAARLTTTERTRTDLIASAVRHVLRYGKLGKQSESRLRAAINAIDLDTSRV